jgi:hypothetical protein
LRRRVDATAQKLAALKPQKVKKNRGRFSDPAAGVPDRKPPDLAGECLLPHGGHHPHEARSLGNQQDEEANGADRDEEGFHLLGSLAGKRHKFSFERALFNRNIFWHGASLKQNPSIVNLDRRNKVRHAQIFADRRFSVQDTHYT